MTSTNLSDPVLPSDYGDRIEHWKTVWKNLTVNRRVTMPNKIHILNDHLKVLYCTVGVDYVI